MQQNSPRIDLRPGVTKPVVLLITRRQVNDQDLASVLDGLRILTAAREDIWRYRGQMSLVVDGYKEDPRELIEIPEVRALIETLCEAWPFWGFFFNRLDESLKILAGCQCACSYPGNGTVEIDIGKLSVFIQKGFDGMNELFDKHGFPEEELDAMSVELVEYFGIESSP